MSEQAPKLPKPYAVAELRERSNKRKEERLKNYKDLSEAWKKKNPSKKIAGNSEPPDVEL
jgi:hypothetical protein